MPIPSPQHEITSWLYCLCGEDHRRKQPRKQPWIPVHALTSWHLHIPILQKYCSFSCWEHYRWFNHWGRWSPEGKYSRLTVVHLKTALKETTYTGLGMWHRPRKSWQGGEKPPECVDGPVAVNCRGRISHLPIPQGGTLEIDTPCPHSSASTDNPAGARGQGSVDGNRAGQPPGAETGWRVDHTKGGVCGQCLVQQI